MPDELLTDSPDEIFKWLQGATGMVWMDDFSGFARKIDGRIVSAVGYNGHTGSCCSIHLALGGRPLGKKMLYFMFDVPFNQWGYKDLLAVVPGGNRAINNLARRLGFKQFAILPNAHPDGGLRFYVMSKADCRWLRVLEKR